jgi:hypothetical protein
MEPTLFTKDIVSGLLVLVILFVVREILTWYFKTNAILAQLRQILQKLEKISAL